jgi:hypothetical protein
MTSVADRDTRRDECSASVPVYLFMLKVCNAYGGGAECAAQCATQQQQC